MLNRFFFTALLLSNFGFLYSQSNVRPFFQASPRQPYHLSVGAVLFDLQGRIACHHFEEIQGQKDIFILMRESVENEENLLNTLHRGLMEEFGAIAEPKAFLGCLSGFLLDPRLSFEKTTLYIACQLVEWDPAKRDMNDPEAGSIIEWLEPRNLIEIMRKQGKKFKRVDADESAMIARALPYIQEALQGNSQNSSFYSRMGNLNGMGKDTPLLREQLLTGSIPEKERVKQPSRAISGTKQLGPGKRCQLKKNGRYE